eukprot:6490530-Amphidinium_carterae.3
MSEACSSSGVKRRKVQWKIERENRQTQLARGPASIDELLAWPRWLLGVLVEEPDLRLRLVAHVTGGLSLSSDYSGIDCPRQCVDMVLAHAGEILQCDLPEVPLHVSRTCDFGSLQSSLAVQYSKECCQGSVCHFHDIADRLPAVDRRFLQASMPSRKAAAGVKAKSYNDIRSWVSKNRDRFFPSDGTSYCMVHDRECPVVPAIPRVPEASVERLKMSVAGVTCHSWSTLGAQEGANHESEVPLSLWLHEKAIRLERGEDHLIYLECTPRFDAQTRIKEVVGRDVTVVEIRVGPEDLGWPSKRRRVLAAAFSSQHLQWVGPPIERIEDDFRNKFFRAIVLSGCDLLVETKERREEEMLALAHSRRFQLSKTDLSGKDTLELLSRVYAPGHVARFQEWQNHIRDHPRLSQLRSLLFDLDHAPNSKGCTAGEDFPVQLRHGNILGFFPATGEFKVATGLEHLAALGWPVSQLCQAQQEQTLAGKERVLGMLNLLAQLSPNQQKLLSGNSMHLVTQAAWMFYILGNAVRVMPVSPARPLKLGSWEVHDEEVTDLDV